MVGLQIYLFSPDSYLPILMRSAQAESMIEDIEEQQAGEEFSEHLLESAYLDSLIDGNQQSLAY